MFESLASLESLKAEYSLSRLVEDYRLALSGLMAQYGWHMAGLGEPCNAMERELSHFAHTESAFELVGTNVSYTHQSKGTAGEMDLIGMGTSGWLIVAEAKIGSARKLPDQTEDVLSQMRRIGLNHVADRYIIFTEEPSVLLAQARERVKNGLQPMGFVDRSEEYIHQAEKEVIKFVGLNGFKQLFGRTTSATES